MLYALVVVILISGEHEVVQKDMTMQACFTMLSQTHAVSGLHYYCDNRERSK